MRTSLVPNRANLFRDAQPFTTTRATSSHHPQIRNRTLETQTAMVRDLRLREPRRGRRVSVGVRLGR